MEQKLSLRHLDLVSIHRKDDEPMTVANPRIPLSDLKPIPEEVLREGLMGHVFSWQDSLGSGQLIRSGAPIFARQGRQVIGVAVAGGFVGKEASALTSAIARNVDTYRQLRLQKSNIK